MSVTLELTTHFISSFSARLRHSKTGIKCRGLVMTKLECNCFIARAHYLGLYL